MEAKVYKIGFKRKRKDARRHLLTSFKQVSDDMAACEMYEILRDKDIENYEYRLYTGNWIEVSMCSDHCSACPDFKCPHNQEKERRKQWQRKKEMPGSTNA